MKLQTTTYYIPWTSNIRRYLFVIFTILISGIGYGQNRHSAVDLPTYVCQKIDYQITIDGNAEPTEWGNIEVLSDFTDIRGPIDPDMLKTEIKMCWDTTNLYVYANMKDPQILATKVDHDDVIYRDDAIEVFIDPDGDGIHYYEFEWNALNTLWDLILLRPYKVATQAVALSSFEAVGVQSAVQIAIEDSSLGQGWSIEVAIPWASILELASDHTPEEGDIMRMNVCRVEWPNQEPHNKDWQAKNENTNPTIWAWASTGKLDIHIPYLWGYVELGGYNITQQKVSLGQDEEVKLLLWDIYWQVRKQQNLDKTYPIDIRKYKFDQVCDAYPKIVTLPNYFEIRHLSCEDPKRSWVLNKMGRMYKE